ncbi:Do family serine endopeptidase [Membranicola marinus]|uniref:Do family serine endopeptidase n=1 Tax=Membranihabitans marinus TaxID=1227546 RepID=A0A953LAC0_9BACT|nr:Do family serine endopeptidase [Membranihabitans marinus]MBY5957446.1 Do family serine endopeptidase [Membranihabitans marinus]
MKKNIIISAVVALLVTVLTIGGYHYFTTDKKVPVTFQRELDAPVNNVLYTMDAEGNAVPLDFTQTAKKVAPAVVQINVEISSRSAGRSQQRELRDPFQDFFNDDFFRDMFPRQRRSPQNPRQRDAPVARGKGSGVIINSNGYIVTNNHVVENASKVEVVMNNQATYQAEIIGTDPTSDLALIKIDEQDLPHVKMVNSDDVQIGEWVLAIGNPLSFGSTVTAGIVSATGRNINIFDRNENPYAVESFIQTDAAINKGNSGGALVNMNGDLIGINAAIASPTGYYAGYGFAIPSNLVNKVVEDLLEYGEVRRAILGVTIAEVNQHLAEEKNLDVSQGVYVDSVIANSSAADAGIMSGDVIVRMDNERVTSMPVLQEKIASKRPGEKIDMTINRNGKTVNTTVTLKSLHDTRPEMASVSRSDVERQLGASLESLTSEEKEELNLEYGVKVTKLGRGILMTHTNIEEGFIITKINDQPVSSVKQLAEILKSRKDSGVLIEGIYPARPGEKIYEAFGM